jgi:hypothetical protein
MNLVAIDPVSEKSATRANGVSGTLNGSTGLEVRLHF